MREKDYLSIMNPFTEQIKRAERRKMFDALDTFNKVEEEAEQNEKDFADAMAEIATW